MATRAKATSVTANKPKTTTTRRRPVREPLADGDNGKKEEKDKVQSKIKSTRRESSRDKPATIKASTEKARPSHPQKLNTKIASSLKKMESARPDTPPSSRVSKTQFFPSKNMYANALKANGITSTVSSSRRTTPISQRSTPNKVKLTPKAVPVSVLRKQRSGDQGAELSSDSSSISERPRTATLKRGSIVNDNTVGPEAPPPKPSSRVAQPPEENYEEDFDSYESDFDSCSSSTSTIDLDGSDTSSTSSDCKSITKRVNSASTDDEKKLDSGNYELPEAKHKQMLDNIKESVEKDGELHLIDHSRSNMGSLSDEGFEDGKSLQFINFLGAQKRYERRRSMQKRRKRGEEILSMIRLDTFNFTLFDMPPVPYDEFIKNYGKRNTVQTSAQTGEDNVSESVQTAEITVNNKWTQFPPAVSTVYSDDRDFWTTYKCNYVGVGADEEYAQIETTATGDTWSVMDRFILPAANLILNLLAESATSETSTQNKTSNLPFAKSSITYETRSQTSLRNRTITGVDFVGTKSKFVTIHGKDHQDCNHINIISVWTLDSKSPEFQLSSFGDIVCTTMADSLNLLFAGQADGAIVAWDMSPNDTVSTPAYSTDVCYGHLSQIIAIKTLTSEDQDILAGRTITKICSLDEDGHLIIWNAIIKNVHGACITLTINCRTWLKSLYQEIDDFKCTALAISPLNCNHLYIATDCGIILHNLANGTKPAITKYLSGVQGKISCLEMCPFSHEHLTAGFDNGDFKLFSNHTETPLISFSNKEHLAHTSAIDLIRWSPTKPFVFYVKDLSNTLHLWNLKICDMFPTHSVPFKDDIVDIQLSPVLDDQSAYMMVATKDGSVYLHCLNDEFGHQPSSDFEEDKKRFCKYVKMYV